MPRAEIQVKSAVLRSLIGNRKMSVENLAEKSGIDASEIQAILVSDTSMSIARATRLARGFKRPWTVFLLDAPEAPPSHGENHRTVRNQEHRLTPGVAHIYEEASYSLDLAIELAPSEAINLPETTANEQTDPASLARKMRAHLQAPMDEQYELPDPYAALRYWKEKLQAINIYIQERPLPITEVRAFSIRRENYAIAVASTHDHPYARIFSLMHELAHIARDDTGVCDFIDEDQHQRDEAFCNRFASLLLVPPSEFDRIAAAYNFRPGVTPEHDSIVALSRAFRVSQLAIYTRLKSIGLISDFDYSRVYDVSTRGARDSRGRSGGDYYRKAINSAGRKFSEEVFNAHSQGKISYRDIGRMLNVSTKNIGRLREALFQTGGSPSGTSN